MFGRHLEVKLVKNSKETTEATTPLVNPEDVRRIAKDVVKYVTIGAAALMATATVLDTVSKITVNSIDNHQKNKTN